jgi:hypothetical protein
MLVIIIMQQAAVGGGSSPTTTPHVQTAAAVVKQPAADAVRLCSHHRSVALLHAHNAHLIVALLQFAAAAIEITSAAP